MAIFGNQSTTVTYDGKFDTQNHGTWFVMPTAGSLTSISAYVKSEVDNNEYLQFGIYRYAPGSELKGTTGSVLVTNESYHWETLPVDGTLALDAGSYVLCGNNTYDNVAYIYVAAQNATNKSASMLDTFPISLPAWDGGSSDFIFDTTLSIYADYNENPQPKNIIYTKLEINNVEYTDALQVILKKDISDFNSTSSFTVELGNDNGKYNNTFVLNQDVEIWADKNANPAVTQLFLGIIESIRFKGKGQDEKVFLRGRDYGAILQDILVSPRIFKDTETSEIVKSLIDQNARDTGLTYNNVNTTSTTIDKITFSNVSLFDALRELASISGYYFYVDVDKDLNFTQKESISSGLTFDNTNVTKSNFKRTDSDIFNYITVYGDRQFTGAIETFGPQAGSSYVLDDKPYNVSVIGSASPNVPIQPGGILNLNNPETDDVQFLVNFQGQEIILTSGIEGGYNTGWIGSSIIIDYQRSSPLLSIRQDSSSQSTYGMKQKTIIDTNIKDLDEANTRAATFLAEHKNPITMGDMDINGIVDVTPGETCVVDIPFYNINSSTYTILSASYIFNPQNNLTNNVLKLTVNRSPKVNDFIDLFKEQELRLRALEGATVESAITNVELGTGSIAIAGSYIAVKTSIGSSFYFHIPGHNIFNSDTSLLGDMRGGSTFKEGSW